MVLSSRTQTLLFNNNAASGGLVRLPLSVVPHYETRCHVTGAIIPATNKPLFRPNLWSSDEHERFLHGLELFPNGLWKEVAKIVGTRSTRQTMTHAQKYRQKTSGGCCRSQASRQFILTPRKRLRQWRQNVVAPPCNPKRP